MSKCRACENEAEPGSAYCSRHLRAYSGLEAAYPRWRYALGLDWLEYIKAVIRTPGTGVWVREVAVDILEAA